MMGLSLLLRLLWMQSTATERSGFQAVFYCFKTVLKQLKEINKPRPDGGPRTFWVRTALTDRQKLTDLRPAQLGPDLRQVGDFFGNRPFQVIEKHLCMNYELLQCSQNPRLCTRLKEKRRKDLSPSVLIFSKLHNIFFWIL